MSIVFLTIRSVAALKRIRPVPRLETLFCLAAGALAAVTLLCYAVVTWVHLGDRYSIDFIAGIWVALANYVNSGTLYPPLYDGSSFGGTRYMPVYFVLHSLVAQSTGWDYVPSGKLLSLVIVISLIGVTFVIIRRFGVPRSFALLLASFVLLTGPGFQAATSIRADALATLFQLGSVAVIAHLGPRLAVPAGALAALAVFTKLSALWAPPAIALWLVLHHRRAFLPFAASFIGFVLASALAVQLISDGRFLENLAMMAFSGIVDAWFGFKKSTVYTLEMLRNDALATWALVPFVVGSCALAARRRQLTVYHFAWLASVIILLVVMADTGTDSNQFIEPIALGAIILGALWPADRPDTSRIGIVLAIAILWAGGTAFIFQLRAHAQEVTFSLRGGSYPQPCGAPTGRYCVSTDTLLAKIRTKTRILTADPSLSVARGNVPVVLDPWAIPKIEARHPEWVGQLVGRVDAAEFDYVILALRFETVDPEFELWYRDEFGKTLMSAIKRRYQWIGEFDGFHLYVPRE
jgi:hypothetical protein